jgi:hypothetical protein
VGRSVWRVVGSVVFSCCWVSPAQFLSGLSPAGLSSTFCLNFWDSSILEGHVPVFISPRNRVAKLYPQGTGYWRLKFMDIKFDYSTLNFLYSQNRHDKLKILPGISRPTKQLMFIQSVNIMQFFATISSLISELPSHWYSANLSLWLVTSASHHGVTWMREAVTPPLFPSAVGRDGQLVTTAALHTGAELKAPTRFEADWAVKLVWTLRAENNFLPFSEIELRSSSPLHFDMAI